MSQQFSRVQPSNSAVGNDGASLVPATAWEKCTFCQEVTSEPLTVPTRSTKSDVGIGYKTIANLLQRAEEKGYNPFATRLDLCRFDNGGGIEETLISNRAVWHKSCRSKLSEYKIERYVSAKKRANPAGESIPIPAKTRRHSTSLQSGPHQSAVCFFCDKAAETEGLHKASTFSLDSTIRRYATILKDQVLLRKLSVGDMIAIDAHYHKRCLTDLFNRTAKSLCESNDNHSSTYHGIALAQLLSYIEEKRASQDSAPVFKLVDLALMYQARLKDLGVDIKVNSTRLKDRLLANCPSLSASRYGKDVLLAFDTVLGDALNKACDSDSDAEAIVLAKAAQNIRKDIFSEKYSFDGTLDNNCVPESLLALVTMIMEGPNILHQTRRAELATRAGQSVAQLLMFNCVKYASKDRESVRHNKDREGPVPIYVALKIHSETRKRGIVDRLFGLGLCISYDRVLGISSSVANAVIQQFEAEGAVCPTTLLSGVFTTAQADNIDHNPSSVTAKDSFHGTAISLIQHPSDDSRGVDRNAACISLTDTSEKKIRPLPSSYADVLPAEPVKKDVILPAVHGPAKPPADIWHKEKKLEYAWLDDLKRRYGAGELHKNSFISWAAWHASNSDSEQSVKLKTTSALMPMFREKSASIAMITHAMKVAKAAIDLLNPGQIPVLTMDQPLFTLGKRIQWQQPDVFGDAKFVILMGPLHIEMALFKTIGDFVAGSGWTNAIAQADIERSGTADALTHGSNLVKTRHAHQVTAAALYILQHKAYGQYVSECSEEPKDFMDWCEVQVIEHPMFSYWCTVLDFELSILSFVRSIRTSNFQLYVESLGQLVPWFFALDHTNYARWLPVHIRDMLALSTSCPEVYNNLCNGAFTSNKTQRKFSSIALDQAHEQLNANVKGDGGAVGLTENEAALRRWMTAGPEIARMIELFESSLRKRDVSDLHHEQTPSIQEAFARDVRSLVDVIEDMGNPFTDDSKDLLTLDAKDIMPADVIKSVAGARTLGVTQYEAYVEQRLSKREQSVDATIHRNNIPLFSNPKHSGKSAEKQKTAELKSDRSLFSRLYIASQRRDANLDTFFSHENQPQPPSLSNNGKMRQGDKADLLDCLEAVYPSQKTAPTVDAKVLDGGAVVNFLQGIPGKTFQEYGQDIFLAYLKGQLEYTSRVDVVWDRYRDDSLKSQVRADRGSGTRRRVTPKTKVPGNWKSFLRNDQNKEELFTYLSDVAVKAPITGREIYVTSGALVLSSDTNADLNILSPCNHEEADTRVILHALDAARKGACKILIRTVDTDVVVLAIANFFSIQAEEVWIAFGTGKNYRYIPIHRIATGLGKMKSEALAFFHAFTGCDTTSYFASKGKLSAWKTWEVFPDITLCFHSLMINPDSITTEFHKLERFVSLLYDKTNDSGSVNKVRKYLFAQKSREIENIPPTADALEEHAKRAVYQGVHVWGQSLVRQQELPSPALFGWKRKGDSCWIPNWMKLPVVQSACTELISCHCKTLCKGNCKCHKANLPCTSLCGCDGQCFQET